MKNKLLIIGSGELGQQIFHYSKIEGTFEVIGYIDDFKEKGEKVNDIPILGKINEIEDLFKKGLFDYLIIGIGYKYINLRDELYEKFKNKIPFATIIVNPVYVDKTSNIEEGCVLYPGCIIDKNVHICANVILNLGTIVAHDCVIGQSSFCASPKIAGFSKIGKRCFIGVNCIINDNKCVCDDVYMGSASLVTKNINEPGIYYGSPCKKIS